MASIIERNKKFCVVIAYTDENGKRHQKWETCNTLAEAKQRKCEIEYQQQLGTFTVPRCQTLNELLTEYVNLYGKTKWSLSVFATNTALIRHYIEPMIGEMRIREITARTLEKYYQSLLTVQSVPKMTDRRNKKKHDFVKPATIRKIHNLLRSAFTQAEKWDLIEKNPATLATVPKNEPKKREIWDAQTLFQALEQCEDDRLKLCMNLAFACSLRIGELLALTWDCVDISDESIAHGQAYVYVNKELQRVNKTAVKALDKKDILIEFPDQSPNNKTSLVLKKPKTITSMRKVFLPRTVAEMLVKWKMEQDVTIEALGSEYHNYNLVIASSLGSPVESNRIRNAMKQLIEDCALPKVCFHSLRHSSITYKLKLNGGDIKSVQGDSGHAQASMVTDQYSHILDENRKENARLLERAFYRKDDSGETEQPSQPKQIARQTLEPSQESEIDPALLMKLMGNPESAAMLKMLVKAMGQ